MESSVELGWYESIFQKCSRTPNSYTTDEEPRWRRSEFTRSNAVGTFLEESFFTLCGENALTLKSSL